MSTATRLFTRPLIASITDLPARTCSAIAFTLEELEARSNCARVRVLMSAEEVAELAAFIAGSGSSYITGAMLNIDGGFVA